MGVTCIDSCSKRGEGGYMGVTCIDSCSKRGGRLHGGNLYRQLQ